MLSDARAAVAMAVLLVNTGYAPNQCNIGLSPKALSRLEPAVKAAARQPQNLTELRHRIFGGQAFHEGKSFCSGSSERMPKAFFRISFLRLAVWSSFCTRRSS